jgi:tetratricopeptide (TPR) repeat protein
MSAPFDGRPFLRTFALIFLAIVAIFALDTFLANTERAESTVEANRLFEQGRALMQAGKNAQAIDRIKDALAVERGNRGYLRTLAQAQFAAGKITDADATLTELLQNDSTDGLTNLIMGRALLKEGRFAEAISYFHRAIYGHWSENAPQNRLQVRFELVDLLAQRNSKEELLAELLPLQDAAPRDLATQTRIGRLFLQVGSPARAADVFREVLRDHPEDATAHAGLGEAEFARANYRAAERDFLSALRLSPNDPATRRRLDVCHELLMLDPSVRGLSPAERFRRSLRLVELTVDETSQCAGQNPRPELQGLLDKARTVLKAHASAAKDSEVAESNLDLAEQIWQARKQECKSPPAPDSLLALVLARSAQ